MVRGVTCSKQLTNHNTPFQSTNQSILSFEKEGPHRDRLILLTNWEEKLSNNVKYMKNTVFTEHPSMKTYSS